MGVIAQANASILYASTEASWGSTATTTFGTARVTSMDIRSRQGYTGSNELVVSREPAPLIRNDVAAEGSANFELDVQDAVLEQFLASLFGNAFSADYGVSGSIGVGAFAAGVSHYTGTNLFTNISAGDWIRVAGLAASNNGLFYVAAKTSNSDISVVNPVPTVAAPTAGTISGSRLSFSNQTRSLTMVQKVPSVEVLYEVATGMICSAVTIDAAVGALVTGSATFAGRQVVQTTVNPVATGLVGQGTGSIASAIDSIIFYEGGTVTASPVPAMKTTEGWKLSRASFNLASPVTPQGAIGSLGAAGVRIGRPTVTGTMSIYCEHGVAETDGIKDMYDAWLQGLDRNGLAFLFGANLTTSSTAPVYVFHAQRYNMTNAGMPVGGNDSDLFLEVEWAAKNYASTNSAFNIFKL